MPAKAQALQHRWSRDRLPQTHALWRLSLAPGVHLPDVDDWQLLHEGPHSRIFRSDARAPRVLKLVLPRSQPRDGLRKYLACQARREFRGNRILAGLGLHAPTALGWGVTVSPLAHFESALLTTALPAFTSGLAVIRGETDAARRAGFLKRFAEQLARLYGHGYVHKDAHFDNLCVLKGGALAWLDNDIRRPATAAARRRGLAKTLRLLEATGRGDVGVAEWRDFRHHLRRSLAHWPLGEALADEVS